MFGQVKNPAVYLLLVQTLCQHFYEGLHSCLWRPDLFTVLSHALLPTSLTASLPGCSISKGFPLKLMDPLLGGLSSGVSFFWKQPWLAPFLEGIFRGAGAAGGVLTCRGEQFSVSDEGFPQLKRKYVIYAKINLQCRSLVPRMVSTYSLTYLETMHSHR